MHYSRSIVWWHSYCFQIFTQEEEDLIVQTKDAERRTEAFLDIIELKAGTAHEAFIETLGEVYPHIFLMLTDGPGDDDGKLTDGCVRNILRLS